MKVIILKPDSFVKHKNVIGFITFEEDNKVYFSDGRNDDIELTKDQIEEVSEDAVLNELLQDEQLREAAVYNDLAVAHDDYEDEFLNYCKSYE